LELDLAEIALPSALAAFISYMEMDEPFLMKGFEKLGGKKRRLNR
jgi:hypothetical protein